MKRLALIAAVGSLLLAGTGCTSSREVERPPDQQFGHRFDEAPPDGRSTTVIAPPDSARSYFFYPVVIDTVHVRPAPWGSEAAMETRSGLPVEVLVKGAFPDGCSEMHSLSQERLGHLINVDLLMRRPQGAVCISVVRPYRFYFMLEGAYEPGHYTMKINGDVYPFEVLPPPEG